MTGEHPTIVGLNLPERRAAGSDGKMYEITNMVDCRGEETADWRECVTIVVKLAEDAWLPLVVSEYE